MNTYMNTYFIINKSKENFLLAESLISRMSKADREIRKLNNFDGTFSFIIDCTSEEADTLRNEDLTVVQDFPIEYESHLPKGGDFQQVEN